MIQIDEEETIARVLEGDREAFSILIEAYQPAVFNLAFRLTGSAQEADDLAQESFLRAFEKLGQFRRGERFFTWLYTISLNVIRNHLRRRRSRPPVESGPEETAESVSDPAESVIVSEQSRILTGYLLRLSEPVREALVLRYYQGLTFDEIALVTGDSLSAVKMKIYRGLERLRRMMDTDGYREK